MLESLAARLRFLALSFVVVLAVSCVGGLFIWSGLKSLQQQEAWVDRSNQIVNELESSLSSLKDAETIQRGYYLMKEGFELQASRDAITRAWQHFKRVRLLANDGNMLAELEQLEPLISQRIDLLDQGLSDFEASGRKQVSRESVAAGVRVMQSIRRHADLIIARGDNILADRKAEADRRTQLLTVTIGIVIALNIAIACLAYLTMRRQFIRHEIENREKSHQAWLKSGKADLVTLAGGNQDLGSMAERVSAFFAERLRAPAVNVYIERGGILELEAGYSRKRAGASVSRYKIGEGLIGQAALVKHRTDYDRVPGDYFRIESGLGSTLPKHLAFQPIYHREEFIGIIEVALFHPLDSSYDDWLIGVAEAVGAAFSSSRSRQRLQELLAQTQHQSEELQTQQEELRTTNEELEEQTRALMESQERMQLQTEELRQINEELEQQTRSLEQSRADLSTRNEALETSRQRLEQKAHELEQANQYKSEFLAKMSHELRTPLNSSMILATLLAENKDGNLNAQQIEFAKTIYEAGTDLLDLINDILDLSKLEARKLVARPEPLGVQAFAEQVLSIFKGQAETKGLELKLELSPQAPRQVNTDRQRLQQILRNLLSNALKFTEKGAITLIIEPNENDQERTLFRVRDSGIGIPEAKKRLIFEAFEQVDGSISRRYGGTGLGLSISRELAILLGGQISVESFEGKGSQFTLDLPNTLGNAAEEAKRKSLSHDASGLAAPPSALGRPTEASQASNFEFSSSIAQDAASRKATDPEEGALTDEVRERLGTVDPNARTILIIEDDESFRGTVAEAAELHGFTAIEAGDGDSALAILKRHVPQAVLLDSKLPDVSGTTLLDQIRKMPRLKNVPIHMISAIDAQHGAFRLGAIGYLGKTVTVEGVRAALRRLEDVIDRKVKRLLVIEDEPIQRKAILELVKNDDTEIIAVGTGHEALEVLRSPGADCVILDLKLPDMSGFQLLESLGEEGAYSVPPVIVYTGKDLTKEEEDRLRRYSESIIIKGSKSPERLMDEVNLFLHRVETDLPETSQALNRVLSTPLGLIAPEAPRGFEGRKLLLVDDDLRNVFALTSALEGKGFQVTIARNGLEALEKIESQPSFDAVLMDIMMPKMDGFEAMRRIRANSRFKNLPIIALTAKAMKGEHERCIEAGASDYLPKPINLTNLLSVLRVWLPSSSQARPEARP